MGANDATNKELISKIYKHYAAQYQNKSPNQKIEI